MKYFFWIVLFLLNTLHAKSTPTCNTVQLLSIPASEKEKLLNTTYPQDCRVMQIANVATVRCGCFHQLYNAKERFQQLKKQYKHASLASTYTYRFKKNIKEAKRVSVPKQHKTLKNKKNTQQASELRLLLQVFLYKGDLKDAYKVAQVGSKKYPNSYYWNQKMANICQWTNRTAEAMKYLRKMYEIHYSPVLENKLINYGMLYYQYEAIEPLVLNKARRNPTEKNIDELINVYTKVGMPEKVLKVLDGEYKRTKNPLLLTKSLELSLEIGDLDRAKKYVTIIEHNKPYSKVDATLLARYYYINRKINKAYNVLAYAKNKNIIQDSNNTKELNYFDMTSDLAWYLQKNIAAAKASKKLMDAGKARVVDYERIALVYPNINNDVAMQAVKEGYEKYKKTYMFFSYANDAIAKQRFKDLKTLLASIDEKYSPLVKNPLYWMIKSKVYRHYKQFNKEEFALKKALALAPNNMQIKISFLWHFMDINDVKNTKLMLLNIEDDAPLSEALSFPLASAYFYLNDINRASFYLDRMRFNNDKTTRTIAYKFLRAYVKQIQNNKAEFQKIMREITKILKEKMKKNPALKRDNQTLSNYLRAAMYVINSDKFEKKLKKAKPYLTEKNYNEIAYSWAVYNKAFEKSHEIYTKTEHKELWLQFSDALIFQQHTKIENLLDKYLHLLSQGDAVNALNKDGQIALAQSTNFALLNNNDDNQNAYINQIDLSKKRSNMLDAKLSEVLRNPLQQTYIKLSNRSYIGDSWYLLEGFNIYKNKTTNTKLLMNPPTQTYKVNLTLKKEFSRGYIQMQIAYNHRMKNYLSFWIDAEHKATAYFSYGAKIGKNIVAKEGTQLYLGGKKDTLSPRITYHLLPSTAMNLRYELEGYYAQNGLYLGKGDYFKASISKQIHSGYPDILIALFYDKGLYKEKFGSKGIIDRLQKQHYQVLPNNFYNIGINLSYGMKNSQIYTRVWRPYFEFSPSYNSDSKSYSYTFHAGYGGKVFHQDHMSIGASYSDTIQGIGGKIFQFYINYQLLYTSIKEI